MFYQQCCDIWSGTPARLVWIVDISQLLVDKPDEFIIPTTTEGNFIESQPQNNEESDVPADNSASGYKRKLLAQIADAKKKKMTKPLPTDVQILALMKKEHAMNNKLFEKMDSMDEAMKSSMESFSGNVQSLNQTLAGGFAMLRVILQQPGPSHFQPFHAGAYYF